MRMRSLPCVLVVLPVAVACQAPEYEGFTTVSFENTSSSTTVTSGDSETTPVVPTEPTTVTETSGEPPGTGENPKPVIGSFTVDVVTVDHPQNVTLSLEASSDVLTVDIFLNGQHQRTLVPGQFPYQFPITSQSVCHGTGIFTATVRDDRNQTDSMDAQPITCTLPASGSPVYLKTVTGPVGVAFFGVTILPDEDAAIAGMLDGKMAVWRLDLEGNVRPGWPRTLADWTGLPGIGAGPSRATGIDSDASGTMAVVGVTGSGATSRYYAALLNSQGSPIWEDGGSVDGEEAAGVEISPGGLVFVVGSILTSAPADPPAFDGIVRGYPVGYPSQAKRWGDQFGVPPGDADPDKDNVRSERGRAAACLANGECVAVGEREVPGGINGLITRAFAQRYIATGARSGEMWTADGAKFAQNAALAVCRTATGAAMTGWGRHNDLGALAQLFTQELDLEGELLWSSSEPTPGEAMGNGIVMDRAGRLVHAGLITLPGHTDVWSFASPGPGEPLAGAHTFDGGSTFDVAFAVDAGEWGHFTWVGVTTVDGKSAGVVSKRNP